MFLILIRHSTAKLPRCLSGKESTCNAGDLGLIPGSGRSLGDKNGTPLQYPYLENSMDRGAWHLQCMGSQRVWHDRVTENACKEDVWKYPIFFIALYMFLLESDISVALLQIDALPHLFALFFLWVKALKIVVKSIISQLRGRVI